MKNKIITTIVAIISYFGTLSAGALIAVGIECGFSWTLAIGITAGLLLSICAGYSVYENIVYGENE